MGLITETEGPPAPPWGPGRILSRFALCSPLQCFHFPSVSHGPPLGNAGSVPPLVVGHSFTDIYTCIRQVYIRNGGGRAGPRRGRAWCACVFERLGEARDRACIFEKALIRREGAPAGERGGEHAQAWGVAGGAGGVSNA